MSSIYIELADGHGKISREVSEKFSEKWWDLFDL